MVSASLYSIGVVGALLNVLCISFNILLAIVLFKCRKELFQNPFFKTAGHLIIAEVSISISQLLIVTPNLIVGESYKDEYYFANYKLMQIPNAIMMLCYDCYYYLQFLIAVYRFMTIHHRSNFFEDWTMHVFCAIIWCWCLFEGIAMVTGDCAKIYRPPFHYVGLLCSDKTTDGVKADYFRFLVITVVEYLNFVLPVISMVVYTGLYVKICIYQAVQVEPVRSFSDVAPVKPLNFFQKLRMGLCQTGKVTNKHHVRIVYQGLFMILLLAGEPLFNVIFSYVERPVDNIGYQIVAYCFIYSTTPTNFLVFYVFNRQTRKHLNMQVGEMFGKKYTIQQQRRQTLSTMT